MLIAKITPCFENGKATITTNLTNPIGYGSTEFYVLRPDTNKAVIKYVFYLIWNKPFRFHGHKAMRGAAGHKRLPLDFLSNFKIPLPPLPEQQKITEILDAADKLRQKDQQLIDHYDRLTQSLFLDMFGDLVINSMDWPKAILSEVADVSSGVTKGRKAKSDFNKDLPYMRVANVQDGYLDLQEIKTIPGNDNDLIKYGLNQGDVLLTEGGDPDKLGRGVVWHNEVENCIHQNHIFKVRITSDKIIPLFLSKLCGSEHGKRYFLKSGKQTTGIASINKTQLTRLPVYLPPLTLQNQFAERIEQIEAQKALAQQNLQKSQELFNSLLQRGFKGELT